MFQYEFGEGKSKQMCHDSEIVRQEEFHMTQGKVNVFVVFDPSSD